MWSQGVSMGDPDRPQGHSVLVSAKLRGQSLPQGSARTIRRFPEIFKHFMRHTENTVITKARVLRNTTKDIVKVVCVT